MSNNDGSPLTWTSEDQKNYDRNKKLNEEIAQLKKELQAARAENEELMRADYWQDRHDIVVKELEKVKKILLTHGIKLP